MSKDSFVLNWLVLVSMPFNSHFHFVAKSREPANGSGKHECTSRTSVAECQLFYGKFLTSQKMKNHNYKTY